VRAVPGAIPADVCDALIAGARPRLKPARVYDTETDGFTTRDARRNSAAEFGVGDMDLVLLAVRERLCAIAGLPPVQTDGAQVLHYAVGERFVDHVDYFEPSVEAHARHIAQGGQRVATLLVYLNEELEGGETCFPRLGISHRGGKGDVLTFVNVDAQGRGDPRTLHAGLAPTAGEKWVLSQWVRDRAPPGLGDPRLMAALYGR
jgi:prolyl 4-hydroxylase